MTSKLILAPGKERPVLRGHPWIFAGAVQTEPAKTSPGATVMVLCARGEELGWAAWSPASQIRARLWSTDVSRPIDHAFFKRRVQAALELRRATVPHFEQLDGVRLLHGEADGLPGVICDRYADYLVLQITSAGGEKWRDAIADALLAQTGLGNIYERSDSDVRQMEGLEPRTGVMRGAALPESLSILENGVRLRVDIAHGHKTGFYLDQRDNRALVGQWARERRVLNCFCYTGGFSLAALAGGAAEVLSIDSSAEALNLAQANVKDNFPELEPRAQWLKADVFEALRQLKTQGREFDLIVLDPPKLAPSRHHVERAARAYKDLALFGLRLLAPGGFLFTYSCSGAISAEMFEKIVADAAADAPAEAVIVERLRAGCDHPLKLSFPEGEYLKGLALRKMFNYC
ncbi:MAG: class I SAM-dependent methyltransferase [Burkholderiales bacterium]|nr:class I SAM-dependent methyltransferase [Burkholderiales bacterium]